MLHLYSLLTASLLAAGHEEASTRWLVVGDLHNINIDSRGSTAAEGRQRIVDAPIPPFDIERDLISLHYDNAPDQDDLHSAAMDRTILEEAFGCGEKSAHFWPVSPTYGAANRNWYNRGSVKVMRAVWGPCGGWRNAHDNDATDIDRYDAAVAKTAKKWRRFIHRYNGKVYVKEGGQSDFTADVIRYMRMNFTEDIHGPENYFVVQHSNWNEQYTTPEDLEYVKNETTYARIRDANSYLRVVGDDDFVFEWRNRTTSSEKYGEYWSVAIENFMRSGWGPTTGQPIIDFSDTGELMHILGMPRYSAAELLDIYFPLEQA